MKKRTYLSVCRSTDSFISGGKHAGTAGAHRRRAIRIFSLVFAGFLCFSLVNITDLLPIDTYAAELRISDPYGVNIRSGPGTEYEILETLPYDYRFTQEDLATDSQGREWYAVPYTDDSGQTITAYVIAQYVEPVSKDTEKTEETQTTKSEENDTETDDLSQYDQGLLDSLFEPGYQASWSGSIQSEAEFEAQLSQFPSSYHDGLRAVHAVYPNYRFIADYPGMDFWDLVDAEKEKKIEDIYPESYRAMYDESFGYYQNYDWNSGEWTMSEGSYTYASDEVIAYYLDPRNFLNTSEIYMFVRQSYSGDISVDDIRSFLEGTFLANGYTPNPNDEDDQRLGGDYAQVLMEAAQISGVSPFVLATTIFTEQGYYGDSPLISGYYEADDETKYVSLFNFFNFGATGSDTNDVIVNGLERAKSEGWTSRYKSILGGSIGYGEYYINNDQDTYYYKNFNVMNGYTSLWHQYATSVTNSYGSGIIMKEVMEDSTYAALEFRIPVYENMPSSAAQLPESSSGQNNYYFADMDVAGLEPEFSMSNRNYTMGMSSDTTLKIAIPQWATYEGYDAYAISAGETVVQLDVRSQTGYLRSYYITVTAPNPCTLYVETYEATHLSISDNVSEGRGDANGDGKISALDYIAIKNHIMESNVITDPALLDAADVNGDGKVSTLDYIAIKNYIMSK